MNRKPIALGTAVAAGLAFASSALAVPTLHAQERMSIQGYGGIAMPTGRLADVTEAGPTLGVQMSLPLTSRTALRVGGDRDELGGARFGSMRAPDITQWRYGVGVERELFAQRASSRPAVVRGPRSRLPTPARWSLVGDVGVGATHYDSKSFTSVSGTREFSETYLATDAGLTVRYRAASRVQLFARTRGNLTFADKSDTAVLAALDPETRARAFGSAVTVPVSAGFTIRM